MSPNQDSRRIGLPPSSSNTAQEPEFTRILPDGITLHVARLPLRRVEADSTAHIADRLETVIGKPVLTTNQVSLWAEPRQIGYQAPVFGGTSSCESI